MFVKVLQFIRVNARSKGLLIGVAAGALALGLGVAPAAGFFGHGKSSSGAQLSAQLSPQASKPGVPASRVNTLASGPGLPAPQVSQAANWQRIDGSRLTAAPKFTGSPGTKQVVFDHTSGICQSGLTAGTPTDSFAVISTHAGNVSAEVSFKGLAPNTIYQVDLVQTPSGESCLMSPGEASLQTNGQGNGNAHWSERILPGQTGVFVMIISPGFSDILATPTVPLR